MKTNVERQRDFRVAMERQNMVVLTVFVRKDQMADIRAAINGLKEDVDLELGPYRNVRTGKLVKRR